MVNRNGAAAGTIRLRALWRRQGEWIADGERETGRHRRETGSMWCLSDTACGIGSGVESSIADAGSECFRLRAYIPPSRCLRRRSWLLFRKAADA